MINILRSKRGDSYIDLVVIVLCAMLVIAIAMNVFPVFVTKNQLDNYAVELVREAEIAGRVGTETSQRVAVLNEKLGITPEVSWSRTGNIQLNEEISVTVSLKRDIGHFGHFGSFPITISAKATGKSERYWK